MTVTWWALDNAALREPFRRLGVGEHASQRSAA